MTAPSSSRTRALLYAGLAAGLLLRCLMLGYRGMFDVGDYMRWGNGSLDAGLAPSYIGIYFPLQYQIFEVCAWLARALGLDPHVVFKAANLPFDLGTCALLISLLARARVSVLYALVYWLHPWFIVVFGLGYVDFQIAFFVVLTVWLLGRGETRKDYLLAGVAFAAAALMKPQVILLGVALAMYIAARWVRTRRLDALWLLAPAALLGAAYEVYFTLALRPALGWSALGVLPVSYVRTGSVMPVLTAHMLNLWYPIAFALKGPGAEIWTVSSKIDLLPHLQVRFAALFGVLAVTAWYAWVVAASTRPLSGADRIRYLFTFTAFIVPAIMTSAHENHLFLATVLLVPLLAPGPDGGGRWAIQALLAIQVVNIEGIYGVDRFAMWLRPRYSFEIRTALSMVSLVCFFFVGRQLYRSVRSDPAERAAILGTAGG
jgi:4-amino-4-deoxy-L-arabinose transferase-like glycosyltransferase